MTEAPGATPCAAASWPARWGWAGAGLAAWIVAWWAAVVVFEVRPDFLPTPPQVLEKLLWLARNEVGGGTLWVHAGWSVLRFLAGFVLAALLGIPLGLLMGQVRWIRDLLQPLFDLMRNIPPIAWAPFALLWFGASFGSQIFVIFTSAFPPILINAYQGMRLTDRGFLRAARMLGARRATILFRVGLPAALPLVVAGLRIGVTNGWLALVGAEIIAGPGALTGLGYLILVGQENLQAALTISAMGVIGVLGAGFDFALRRLETLANRYR